MTNLTMSELGGLGRAIVYDRRELDNLAACTIIAYIYPKPARNYSYIWGKLASNGQPKRFFIDHNQGNPYLVFGLASGTTWLPTANSGHDMPYYKWQHVAAMYNGGRKGADISLYIDDKLSIADRQDAMSAISSDVGTATHLMNRQGLDRELASDLGYVAIYNRVLTSLEYAQVRMSGPLIVPNGLVLLHANGRDLSPNYFPCVSDTSVGLIPPMIPLGDDIGTPVPQPGTQPGLPFNLHGTWDITVNTDGTYTVTGTGSIVP